MNCSTVLTVYCMKQSVPDVTACAPKRWSKPQLSLPEQKKSPVEPEGHGAFEVLFLMRCSGLQVQAYKSEPVIFQSS